MSSFYCRNDTQPTEGTPWDNSESKYGLSKSLGFRTRPGLGRYYDSDLLIKYESSDKRSLSTRL